MTTDVVVGYCHPGSVSGVFLDGMLDLVAGGQTDGWIGNESGPGIAAARNQVVDSFLTFKTSPWLLMVDADMAFTRQDVVDLLASADPKERPIVGGLCFTYGKTELRPTLYTDNGREPVWDYPRDAMCQVDATGTAFLLIHRSVLEALAAHFAESAYKWFAEGEYGGEVIGEDVTFCLRARSLGFPVHVNTAVKIGHRKERTVTEDLYWTWRRAYHEANA